MSFHKYCDNCKEEMPEPTHREVLANNYVCKMCGAENTPLWGLEHVIENLLERVEDLETKVKRLARRR